MDCGNNSTMLGLHHDGDNPFEAAFIHTRWPDPHNNLIPQTEIYQTEEAMLLMPITICEMENVLAARATNAHTHTSLHTCNKAAPELDTDFSTIFQEANAHYKGADIPLSNNINDLDMPSYIDPPSTIMDTFGNLEQPRFNESAEGFGALTDQFAYQSGDSAGTLTPKNMNRPMKQSNLTNDNVAQTPIQTGDSLLYQSDCRESSLQAWSIGSKCTWPECTSRAVFKTFASFNMHLTNVHTHPLLCSIANCQQKTPFGRLSDLRRHQQSAHTRERKYVCRVKTCNAAIKEFSRKDHLVKHRRERHVNYFCPINHCPRSTKSSFDKPDDVLQHIKAEHGSYECALKACSQAPLSQFDSLALLNHLRNHHAIPDATAVHVKERMESRLSNKVTESDLGRASCGECKTCEERKSVTEEKA